MEYDIKKYESKTVYSSYVEKIEKLNSEAEQRFEKLKEQIISEVNGINQTELVKEQNRNIEIMQKYISIKSEESERLKKVYRKKIEIEGELNDYYRFNWDKSTKLSETAINKYVNAHPCLLVLTNYIKTIEVVIQYLEDTIDNIKNRNYAIRNLIDLKKMELGIS